MTGGAVRVDSITAHPHHHIAPILRIPCEIISGIFGFCLPNDEFPRPSIKSAPMQLSHVCSAWRKLAIQTPRLWSKILLCTGVHDFEHLGWTQTPRYLTTIMFFGSEDMGDTSTNGSFTTTLESHVEALEVWIRRSTPLLLSLHVRYPKLPPVPYSLGVDELPPVFRVIIESAARWKDVRLGLPLDYLSFACRITQENASNLESLYVDNMSIPMSGPVYVHYPRCPPHYVWADTAKTLSHLSVRGRIIYTPPIETSFARLHTLKLEHLALVDVPVILRCCPALEDLTIHFHDLPEEIVYGSRSHHHAKLPRLRDFHLAHTGNSENGDSKLASGGEVGILLDHLELPNLKGFYLWMTIISYERYSNPERPWDYLSRLITRSNCSLNNLELRTPHIETSSIIKCLQLSPDLKYLGILADEDLERQVAQLKPDLQSLRIFQ
ncbi:hypothetical protein BD410DRAFT_797537 [Rickenella mellea]|uniref:Uncharacterized protein n=1 Tax=Rickenella mellea TaxID=50990 RepID=A0A4Y7PEP1_9AGAM|nr:hypothetical protein BD410DRAFT_797537 [Rickenella mellea]